MRPGADCYFFFFFLFCLFAFFFICLERIAALFICFQMKKILSADFLWKERDGDLLGGFACITSFV